MHSRDSLRADVVTVVGVGLIGGSLAGAIRQRGIAGRVIGVGRDAYRLSPAVAAGLIDEATADLRRAAAASQLIVFCTPVDQIVAQVRTIAEVVQPGTLVTDAGSVKQSICLELAEMAATPAVFVGSHPLAGSEKTGFAHANPELFAGRTCVVTPLPEHREADVARVEQFWRQVGMDVLRMSPADHDEALARTSHVPHVIAAALAGLLEARHRPLAATGFRDTTRIAAGDPGLWKAILAQNSAAVIAGVREVEARLAEFREALAAGDLATVDQLLAQGKANRDALD